MSKTYLNQVNKAKDLAAGLKKNLSRVGGYGINLEEIVKLEEAAARGAQLNEEVERIRAEASEKMAVANRQLDEIKNIMSGFKYIIKHNFDAAQWADFGLPDKR
ncbi:MAG: hypothetical protein ACOYJE_00965 [Bacteroidaceae bacterium]|jgi:hypothetical protein